MEKKIEENKENKNIEIKLSKIELNITEILTEISKQN